MISGRFTKTQIDNLGERLRAGNFSMEDLMMLDNFRLSFETSYAKVVQELSALKLTPTGRPAKSTPSVIDKLQRETTRLSQMQDIAGCRVIVDDLPKQNTTLDTLIAVFPKVTMIDRREKPNHGYRAVHLVVHVFGKPVEVQVRTELQHAWAEISEKLSDFDSSIKYGGGAKEIRTILDNVATHIKLIEEQEDILLKLRDYDTNSAFELEQRQERLAQRKRDLHEGCKGLILALVSVRERAKS